MRHMISSIKRLRYFKRKSHVPHFQMIRTVESILISKFTKGHDQPLLDLGCGDGVFADSLDTSPLVGIDIDRKVLANSKSDRKRHFTIQSDAKYLPFASETFATIFSNCALEHMDSLQDILSEIRRILTRTGNFVFTVPTDHFFRMAKNDPVLRKQQLNEQQALDQYNLAHHHVNIFDFNTWVQVLAQAGFTIASWAFYLPGRIGQFIARMDILYTLKSNRELIRKLEKSFLGIGGLPLRFYFALYICHIGHRNSGTHILFKVNKTNK